VTRTIVVAVLVAMLVWLLLSSLVVIFMALVFSRPSNDELDTPEEDSPPINNNGAFRPRGR